MASYLKEHYEPSERILNNLRKYGAIPEFVTDQLDNFRMYWLALKDKQLEKGKKTDWDSTCFNWMRRAWQGKTGREWEKSRHYQMRAPSKGDPFENALDLIEKKPKPMEPAKDYVIPELPERTGPVMKPEEAFAELRRMGVL